MKPISHFLTLVLFITILISAANHAHAQAEANTARQVVDRLFDGMRNGDSTAVRSVFTKTATLTSISKNAADSVITHKGSVDGFVKAVGSPHKDQWDERIYDVKVSIDGPMAVVWAPYKFHLGGKFSHCGVNVFNLIKTSTGWKINDITDTRRKDFCP
ncbi:nuclear transport factor 2 family protein [Dyadobacter sp. CY261]|uniref:nuclear transport factor 2 family protein n=1 Tax=Dyadobacter sp. CY261 TaxID=2907203 RepID=UPI001F2C1546|nr:nuclear transport factor 2 family protein [Dyadobacter sp. CY261]MCF0071530.1 nuclear transport factor 2 family protein [Dyadobacter sp. CY261]